LRLLRGLAGKPPARIRIEHGPEDLGAAAFMSFHVTHRADGLATGKV